MSLILPIMIVAVVIGLTQKRMTFPKWLAVGLWICLVIAYYYIKH